MRAEPRTALAVDTAGRWSTAAIGVAACHVLVAMFIASRMPVADIVFDPPEAILLELEAAPAEAAPSELPPAEEQAEELPAPVEEIPEEVIEEPEPIEPEVEPVEEVPEEIEPMEETDLAIVVPRLPRTRPEPPKTAELKKPDRKQPEKPRPVVRREPKPKPTARPPAKASAPAAAPRKADSVAAPKAGAKAGRSSVSPAEWQSRVFRHLERHKRYPSGSKARGTVRVRFTIDASGRITGHRITGSSGFPELDQAVSSLIARASPIPAPPADAYRPGLSIEVPIRFAAR